MLESFRRGVAQRRQAALGRPGANPLFFGVLGAVLLSAAAGLSISPVQITKVTVIDRILTGGIVLAVAYGVVVVLWLAWHRKTLKKLGIGPASGEAPDPGTAQEITERDREISEFMGATTQALDEINSRLATLEGQNRRP